MRNEFKLAMDRYSNLCETLADGLIKRDVFSREVYKLGENTLNSFRTNFFEGRLEDHIGEYISDSKGRLQYLKTYRLGVDQLNRGKLLQRLEENDWDISVCAKVDQLSREQWLSRFIISGLGHILNENTLSEVRHKC